MQDRVLSCTQYITECLRHSSLCLVVIVDKHIRFALTGAGSSDESRGYVDVRAVAVDQDRKNEEPLYESMDGESVL